MRWTQTQSTSVAAIGYDHRSHELGVEFRQSSYVYIYFNVPVEEYRAFLAADSKGQYLNYAFKPKGYRYSGPYPTRKHAA